MLIRKNGSLWLPSIPLAEELSRHDLYNYQSHLESKQPDAGNRFKLAWNALEIAYQNPYNNRHQGNEGITSPPVMTVVLAPKVGQALSADKGLGKGLPSTDPDEYRVAIYRRVAHFMSQEASGGHMVSAEVIALDTLSSAIIDDIETNTYA